MPQSSDEEAFYAFNQHPCRRAARDIWAKFAGIPITEPYVPEFEWLENRLLDLKDELSGNPKKRSLTDVCKELKP